MKKSLTIITLLAGAAGAFAQGTISFSDGVADHNYTTQFYTQVYSPQTATPTVQQYGNTSYGSDTPAGTTTYTGVPIGGGVNNSTSEGIYGNGNLWTAAFFAVPGVNNTTGLAAAEAAFTPISTSLFIAANDNWIGTANAGLNGQGAAGMWANNNRFSGSNAGKGVALPSVGPLGPFPATGGATVQILVWYNAGGLTFANSSIEGVSEVVSVDTLGTTTANAPNLGLNAAGPGDTWGGADANYGPLTSFSLEVVPELTTIALGVLGASVFLFRYRRNK